MPFKKAISYNSFIELVAALPKDLISLLSVPQWIHLACEFLLNRKRTREADGKGTIVFVKRFREEKKDQGSAVSSTL